MPIASVRADHLSECSAPMCGHATYPRARVNKNRVGAHVNPLSGAWAPCPRSTSRAQLRISGLTPHLKGPGAAPRRTPLVIAVGSLHYISHAIPRRHIPRRRKNREIPTPSIQILKYPQVNCMRNCVFTVDRPRSSHRLNGRHQQRENASSPRRVPPQRNAHPTPPAGKTGAAPARC